ncbi:MAG: zinc ribbon domain-containing protein [Vicinamibacterales bacterium]
MSSATSTDPGLRPWQLFVLAGMLAATAVVLVSTGQTLSSVIVLSLTVVASSLVAVAAFQALGPLVVADLAADEPAVEGHARTALEREKALVLRSLKELEFDHAMKKTATADFEEMQARLRHRAVGLMQQLDASSYRAAIERDLATRTGAGPGTPVGDDVGIAAAPGAPVCAACQTANDRDARFCKQCGAALSRPA